MCYKYIVLPLALVVGLLTWPASGQDTPRRSIVATTGMVADLARNIAGDRATVVSIMGEGVDPHLYKPKAADVRRILAADVVLYNGLKLEGRMGDVFKRAKAKGLPVHAVTATLPEDLLLVDVESPDHPDPHVWMDVKTWAAAVEGVTKVLCEADLEGCPTYRANAQAYVARLRELNRRVTATMRSIPKDQRVLVTAHDAFQYLGRAYGLEVRGIQGLSTESEAGLSDLNELVDFLVERKIPAVFIESSVSPKNVQALIEGARARGHEVIVGGELYSDAMGQPGTPAGTYVGMIEHNMNTIAAALGGEPYVPEPDPGASPGTEGS